MVISMIAFIQIPFSQWLTCGRHWTAFELLHPLLSVRRSIESEFLNVATQSNTLGATVVRKSHVVPIDCFP